LKLEEEFPSCFENMTRLTYFYLYNTRGENPEPIPFPTQFCNMIYLQTFTSSYNNFSGFLRRIGRLIIGLIEFRYYFVIGQIPLDLTRLKGLKRLYLAYETSLEGF